MVVVALVVVEFIITKLVIVEVALLAKIPPEPPPERVDREPTFSEVLMVSASLTITAPSESISCPKLSMERPAGKKLVPLTSKVLVAIKP